MRFKTRVQNHYDDVELLNDTSTVAYVGLQLMKGKIIVLDNSLKETRNMVIKDNYIIAHTSNVLVNKYRASDVNNQLDYSLQRHLSQISSRSEKMTAKELPNIMKRFLTEKAMLATVYNEGLIKSSELIFLQTQSNFIEKTLGSGEIMKLRFECLVAYSPSIKIVKGVGNDFELNPRG